MKRCASLSGLVPWPPVCLRAMSHADCEIDVLAGIDSGLGTILLLDISRIEQQGLLKNLRRGPFTRTAF